MSERLDKLAEAGGAPNYVANAEKARTMLLDLEGALDVINTDATAIADAYGTEEPGPFEIGYETIGALALLIQELRDTLPELERYADRIGSQLYGIDAMRRQQEAGATV